MTIDHGALMQGLQDLEIAATVDHRATELVKSVGVPREEAVQRVLRDYGLTKMAKSVTTSVMTALVPEDLEFSAFNMLWEPDNHQVLQALKLFPTTPATQVVHKFPRITQYGDDRGMGFVNEQSVPQRSIPAFVQRQTNIRMVAAMAEVTQLAALEQTVNALGTTGAEAVTKTSLLRSHLWRLNRGLYYSDTRKDREGSSGIRFRGLRQCIEEGTDGTEDSSEFGSHVIDAEGQPLTMDFIRKHLVKIINNYGTPSVMITSPEVRMDFESTLDGAGRMSYPIQDGGYVLGQRVGGLRSLGFDTAFATDLMLGPLKGQGKYRASAMLGAPNNPSVSVSAGALGGGRTSKFAATDAGSYFYVVTEVKDDSESVGTTSSNVTIAANQEVTLTLTPSDPNSNSFRVYRAAAGSAATDAYFCFEVAVGASGAAVTAYDGNHERPGHHHAVFLDIRSGAQEYLNGMQTGVLSRISPVEMVQQFGAQPDSMQNTVTRVRLGPEYGMMELAALTLTRSRPVLFSAQALQLRAPFRNIWVKNIKPRQDA